MTDTKSKKKTPAKRATARKSPPAAPQTINGFPIVRMKVADLKRAPWNPRKIHDDKKMALRRSVETFGLVEPIIANSRTGNTVVGGHQRLDALVAQGVKETDVILVNLSEPQEKQLNIALNKITGDWEHESLVAILQELNDLEGIDATLTGFGAVEIDDLLAGTADVIPPVDLNYKEQYAVVVVCENEENQQEIFDKLTGEGYNCKVVVT